MGVMVAGDLFFRAEDFLGGEVDWSSMEADFDPAREEHYRDLLLVYYPNACSLFLTWYEAREGRPGFFGVALNQRPDYEPFAEYECSALDELRAFVRRCARVAAQRPSVPRRLSQEWSVGTQIDPCEDRLVLDPLAPLATQTDALHGLLLADFIPWHHGLTIGWEPAYRFPGEFIIRFYNDDPDRWELNADDPEKRFPRSSWQLLREWRCANASEIRGIVEQIYGQRWGHGP